MAPTGSEFSDSGIPWPVDAGTSAIERLPAVRPPIAWPLPPAATFDQYLDLVLVSNGPATTVA